MRYYFINFDSPKSTQDIFYTHKLQSDMFFHPLLIDRI